MAITVPKPVVDPLTGFQSSGQNTLIDIDPLVAHLQGISLSDTAFGPAQIAETAGRAIPRIERAAGQIERLTRSLFPGIQETAGIRGEVRGLGKQIQGLAGDVSQDAESIRNIGFGTRDLAGDIGALRGGSALRSLSGGALSGVEQEAIDEALRAVDLGFEGAEQDIEQTVREEAASRGQFGSRGAIIDEASRVAQLKPQKARQRADILGKKADLSRQGLLQGNQLLSSLIGQEAGIGGAAIGQLKEGASLSQAHIDNLLKSISTKGVESGLIGTEAGLLQNILGTLQTSAGLRAGAADVAGGRTSQLLSQDALSFEKGQAQGNFFNNLLSSVGGLFKKG